MRLTVYTDYALRLLTYAALSPDALITIGEVAEAYGISRNHLTKVAHQLGVAGFLETVRGKGGGLRLARKPEAIGLGEVVRHTEPDMALVPCFQPIAARCRILPGCVLQAVLADARDAFLEVLDRHTLADLVGPRDRLRGLLQLPPVVAAAGRHPAKRIPIRAG